MVAMDDVTPDLISELLGPTPVTILGDPATIIHGSKFDQTANTDNPYWEVIRRLPYRYWPFLGERPQVDVMSSVRLLEEHINRETLVRHFSWAIPSPSALTAIANHLAGKPVVEIGAGGGYWKWQLTQLGVDVTAFDRRLGIVPDYRTRLWAEVNKGTPGVVVDFPDHVLMLCWPEFQGQMAMNALRAYKGDTVLFIGEPGLCGSKNFHQTLNSDDEWEEVFLPCAHWTYWCIRCSIYCYKRR